MSTTSSTIEIASALHRELHRIARTEEDRAATEAARVPYWSTCPPSVQGHRAAAAILRAEADRLLVAH